MILGSPVYGFIHPYGWARPAGNLELEITQHFGCTGVLGERPFGSCARYHRAIDMGNGRSGADVIAALAGTVTQAGYNPGGALVVVINHGNGLFTGYAHLMDKTVSVGQHVAKGQKVGDVGNTGSVFPHLHFAVKTGLAIAAYFWGDTHGTWIDPTPHLSQNVTIRPKGDGILLRDTPGGAIYAETKPNGFIYRTSDNTNRGATAGERKWGGIVTGPEYTVAAGKSTRWEMIWLDGAYRYIASLLAIRSQS